LTPVLDSNQTFSGTLESEGGTELRKNNRYLLTYNLFGPVRNAFDVGKSITRVSGRGFGLYKSSVVCNYQNLFSDIGIPYSKVDKLVLKNYS